MLILDKERDLFLKAVYRWTFYILGMRVLALGLTLNTKAGLGGSPIISIAFAVSEVWGWNFGDMTFLLYSLFVAGQIVLRGKHSRLTDLLQLPLSLAFSRVLNLYSALIPYEAAEHGFLANFGLLLAAIFFTGAGAAITVNMKLVPNPGDGIVAAVAERLGRDLGFAKNVFDIGCVAVTCLLGLLADRKSTRLNSSHVSISYAVFCLKKKKGEADGQIRYTPTPKLILRTVKVSRTTSTWRRMTIPQKIMIRE